jgi:quinol monooxygenase YgiN
MSIVLIATINPIPEHREEVIAVLEKVIADTHSDAGCELYALHEGRDALVVIEKWAGKEELGAHATGANFAALTEGLDGKLAAPMAVVSLRPHPAGTAEQGGI